LLRSSFTLQTRPASDPQLVRPITWLCLSRRVIGRPVIYFIRTRPHPCSDQNTSLLSSCSPTARSPAKPSTPFPSTARSFWSFSATLVEPSVARRSPSSPNFVRSLNPRVLASPLSILAPKTALPNFSRRITSMTSRVFPIPTANSTTLSAWSTPNYANTSTAKVSTAC